MCFLFGTKIHNTKSGSVDNDAIMKPGLEVSLYSRSKRPKDVPESTVINGLVKKEVVTRSGLCEIIDCQSRGPEEGILVHGPDKSMESRIAATEIVTFPRIRDESAVRKFTAVCEFWNNDRTEGSRGHVTGRSR